MTASEKPGKDPAARHVYGPRAVGALVPVVTRAAFRARSPAGGMLMADWAIIVGPALAAVTMPRRLQGGTLTIGCAGPVAMELQHLTAELLSRINGALGRPTVAQLRFVQDFHPPPAVAPPVRTVAAPVSVPGLPPGPLHDALAALGGAVRRARGSDTDA